MSFTQHIENRGELIDILQFVLRLISMASRYRSLFLSRHFSAYPTMVKEMEIGADTIIFHVV